MTPARWVRAVCAVGWLVLLSACAAKPRPFPLDGVNRGVFWFNDQLDIYALEPVARGWDRLWPDPVQRGFNNFFDNLRFPIVLVNDILQARPHSAVETIARFQCNTFLGGLGFLDLASDLGVPPHIQDSGLTLGRWGIPAGPYLVLPLLGPSNPRDAVGLLADSLLTIYPYFIAVPGITVGATAVDVVNRRSRVLGQVADAKAASVDYYAFVRDAYTQRRWKLIHGETPASGEQQDELYDTETYDDYMEEGK
ncbi:MAG TPA: VacJ family lipoprotein [Candidatus Dormibacteraeota bacterium]|nr:VacJ family lipoprotein [Candidatus Dormibacteraeota bacterium]